MSSSPEMWITYDGSKKKLRIPVLPDKVEISYPEKNDKVYVYGVGEITIKKNPGAFAMKFSSFFPAHKCQGSISNPSKPSKCADFMIAVMNLPTCARFIYKNGAHSYNFNCTIKYDEYEQGGDPGTIYYSVTITEYKTTQIRKITVKSAVKKAKVSAPSGRPSTITPSKTYTVVRGDCLWNIAKKFYGNGSQYTKIYNANKSVIGGNPNLIYPGQVLTIP